MYNHRLSNPDRQIITVPFPFVTGPQKVRLATDAQYQRFQQISKTQGISDLYSFIMSLPLLNGEITLIDFYYSLSNIQIKKYKNYKMMWFDIYLGMDAFAKRDIKRYFPEIAMAEDPYSLFLIRLMIHELFHVLINYSHWFHPREQSNVNFLQAILKLENFLTDRFRKNPIAITGYSTEYLTNIKKGFFVKPQDLSRNMGNEEATELFTYFWMDAHYFYQYLRMLEEKQKITIEEVEVIISLLQFIAGSIRKTING